MAKTRCACAESPGDQEIWSPPPDLAKTGLRILTEDDDDDWQESRELRGS